MTLSLFQDQVAGKESLDHSNRHRQHDGASLMRQGAAARTKAAISSEVFLRNWVLELQVYLLLRSTIQAGKNGSG